MYNKNVISLGKELNIAMFGGSFNPPHNGHVEVAARALAEFSLDRVLFVVAADPPHKAVSDQVDGETRLLLTRAALEGRDGLEASDMELLRGGKSYTVDTLKELRARFPGAKLYLITGEDMLDTLCAWRDPEGIFSLAGIIAVSRPGALADIEKTAAALSMRFGAAISVSAFGGPDISSTAVRERVFSAKPIDALVPHRAEMLVYEKGLYQPREIRAMMEKLRASLKLKRYLHSVGTMRAAIGLAERFGFDARKARLAGLLHDCAKLPEEELLSLARMYGVEMDVYDKKNPALMHDRVGARHARAVYGVEDEEVLAAIASHTRCEPGMGRFARLVYLADKIEPTRNYAGVGEIRAAAETDMDRAALMCMERSLGHLLEKGADVQPNIYEAIEELRTIIESKQER